MGVAFLTGVAMDVLVGTTLSSFGLSICVYILAANYEDRNYSVWQQAIIISLPALYHLLTFWVQHLLTDIYFQVDYYGQ